MSDLNNISIIGRITRDLNATDGREFGYMNNGTAVLNTSIAVSHSKNENDVSYVSIRVFGKFAESIKDYVKKGQQIGVVGYLKQERWKDSH